MPCQQRAQLGIRQCVVRIDFDGSSKMLLGKIEFGFFSMVVTEIVVSFGVMNLRFTVSILIKLHRTPSNESPARSPTALPRKQDRELALPHHQQSRCVRTAHFSATPCVDHQLASQYLSALDQSQSVVTFGELSAKQHRRPNIHRRVFGRSPGIREVARHPCPMQLVDWRRRGLIGKEMRSCAA